jgi:hypothetical protein
MRAAYETTATAGRRTSAALETMAGGIAMLEGRAAEARAHYAEAQRAWREIGLDYALACCDLDIVVTGAMEPAERRRAAEEARATFARIGAQPFLDRLNAAMAAETGGAPAATGERSGARQPA